MKYLLVENGICQPTSNQRKKKKKKVSPNIRPYVSDKPKSYQARTFFVSDFTDFSKHERHIGPFRGSIRCDVFVSGDLQLTHLKHFLCKLHQISKTKPHVHADMDMDTRHWYQRKLY